MMDSQTVSTKRRYGITGALAMALLGAALFSGAAMAKPDTMVHDSELGQVLTDAKGMTLYTFRKDTDGKSMCNDKCAEAWPPLMADSGAMADGDYSIITRDDGSHQWAYKGMPVYTWFKDTKPGDVTGQGFKDAWDVVHP